MSLIQLPTPDEDLPSIESESDENLAPIVPTLWKCRRQVLGTIVCTLGVFSTGAVFGWASPAIEDMTNDGTIEFDEATMASLFIIGALISGPISGYSMMKIGRKYAMLIFGIILSVGWALLGFGKVVARSSPMSAVTIMYIGRFITGFAGAACLAIAPIYVKEICCDELRSKMGGIVPLQLILGNLYSFVIGSFLPWDIFTFTCLIFPVLQCVLIFWLPESPRCLINKGRYEEGEKSILWYYRGFTSEEGERVFKQLKRAIDYRNDPTRVKHVAKMRAEENVKFTSRGVVHPLIVSVLLIFFQQASGICFVTTYTTDIFKASGDLVSPKVGTILVGVALVVFVLVAVIFLNNFGRKCLLQMGTLVKAICLFALGTFFLLKEKQSSVLDYLTWVPVITTVAYVSAYSLGMGSVPWTLVTEINHPAYREISNTITSTTYWLIAYSVTASLPALRDSIGYHSCCFLYGTFCFIAFFFVTFFIYETKGKTTEAIIAHYRGSSYMEDEVHRAGEAKSLGSLLPAKIQSNNAARAARFSVVSTDTGSSDMNVLYDGGDSI